MAWFVVSLVSGLNIFHYHFKIQLTTVQYTVSSTTDKAVVVVMETHLLSDIKVLAFGTKYYLS